MSRERGCVHDAKKNNGAILTLIINLICVGLDPRCHEETKAWYASHLFSMKIVYLDVCKLIPNRIDITHVLIRLNQLQEHIFRSDGFLLLLALLEG